MRELVLLDSGEVADLELIWHENPGKNLRKSCQSDLLSLIKKMKSTNTFFYSVELIPGTNSKLQGLLKESLQMLSKVPPLFASVTWHSKFLKMSKNQHTGEITEVYHPAFDVIGTLQNIMGIPAIMHLSALSLKKAEVHAILVTAREIGVQSILALRGDIDFKAANQDFPHASDLVTYIRKEFGDSFTIAVAGYPMGHPESVSYEDDLHHLKEKVDSGADFIITQMILSTQELDNFAKDCRQLNINVPIVPGLYVIETKALLQKMIELCKLPTPPAILAKMEEFNGDDSLERSWGIKEMTRILKWLHDSKYFPGAHFFTLNRIEPALKLYQCTTFRQPDPTDSKFYE